MFEIIDFFIIFEYNNNKFCKSEPRLNKAIIGGFTNKKNMLVHPFLKWAGGKRQLLP